MAATGPATSPQYYIADGVHRAVAARENQLAAFPARLVIDGQADQFLLVSLEQLHSPKATVRCTVTPRRNFPALVAALGTTGGRAQVPPIEIQPLGAPGQSASVPLSQVQIIP